MQLIIRLVAAFLFIAFGAGSATAQDATPSSESLLAGQGLPELTLTATDDGLVNVPGSIEAGRYLVTFLNDASTDGNVTIVQVPDDMTYDDIVRALDESATDGAFPQIAYDLVLNGGGFAPSGGSAQVAVDFTPGDWALGYSTEEETSESLPVELKVTGTFPTVDDLPSDVKVGMYEMGFDMPEEITAGPGIWELTNTGEQPHFIEIDRYPTAITDADVAATLSSMTDMATPEADATAEGTVLDFDQLEPVAASGIISSGITNWVELDLEPGHYLALCFVPDEESGVEHAMLGMYKVFEVI